MQAVVGSFCKNLPQHLDLDAIRGAAYESLVRSDQRYDAGRTTKGFAAFACMRAWYAMQDECRYYDVSSLSLSGRSGNARRDVRVTSFDAEHGEEAATLYDMVSAVVDETSSETLALVMSSPRLDRRDKTVCVMLALGFLHREVGEHLGVTESRVSQLVARARERLAA